MESGWGSGDLASAPCVRFTRIKLPQGRLRRLIVVALPPLVEHAYCLRCRPIG